MALLRCAAKFDPFLSLDCAPTPSTLAQSKERKGSNFATWQPRVQGFCANAKFLLELIFTKALATPSFLALVVSYMGYNWGLHTLMSSGALFLTKVHHMSTSQVH